MSGFATFCSKSHTPSYVVSLGRGAARSRRLQRAAELLGIPSPITSCWVRRERTAGASSASESTACSEAGLPRRRPGERVESKINCEISGLFGYNSADSRCKKPSDILLRKLKMNAAQGVGLCQRFFVSSAHLHLWCSARRMGPSIARIMSGSAPIAAEHADPSYGTLLLRIVPN